MVERAREQGATRTGRWARRAACGTAAMLVVAPLLGGPADAVASPPAATPSRAASAIAALERATAGSARVVANGIGGAATFLGAPAGDTLITEHDGDQGNSARAFVNSYGPAFGVAHPATELVEDRRSRGFGEVAVRYRQVHHGIPVFAAEIAVAVRDDGAVTSAAGRAAPQVDVPTSPQISASSAARTATVVAARAEAVDVAGLTASVPELEIYDPALLHVVGDARQHLVWSVDVRDRMGAVDHLVLVDASDGTVALHFGQVESALNRQVCDAAGTAALACAVPAISEGGASPASRPADVRDAFVFSGNTYDVYRLLGRDSIDDAGMPLLSTVDWCPTGNGCSYANAFWNGTRMVYGAGFTRALDVVAHELTHGVTAATSQLLYYGESGAINESMSDVFGELVQQQVQGGDPSWAIGEQLPIGAIRSMSDPPAFGDPDRMTSPLYASDASDDHGVHVNSGVGNKAAYLIARGGSFDGHQLGTGLGALLTLRIYYQAQTTLLTPGSDYRDLAAALTQSCDTLAGIASSGIHPGDCDVVRGAVAATEMAARPTAPGADLQAPRCSAADHAVAAFADDFEAVPDPAWAAGPTSSWSIGTAASQSGVRSLTGADRPTTGLSEVHTTRGVVVPATGTTYLGFDHSFQFDFDPAGVNQPARAYDGGVVQYSTAGASGPWTDVSTLGGNVLHGYDTVLAGYAGNANPLVGRPAFGGESPGFQTTRFDLSPLAGRTVWLRFVVATDASVGGAGWFIDDVAVYQCSSSGGTSGSPTPSGTAPSGTPSGTTIGTSSFGRALEPTGPARLVDTRPGGLDPAGAAQRPIEPDEPLQIHVAGFQGGGAVVPQTGVGAVSLNVAVTGAVADGYLTVYPCGERRLVASVNFSRGGTVSNAVIAQVDADGDICVATSARTDVVVDVFGWLPSGAGYTAVAPQRLFDTRGESPGALADVGVAQVATDGLRVSVADLAGGSLTPPAGQLGAIALNVAVTGAAAGGFVTVYPCGQRPLVASVNFAAGQTVSNAVVAPVAADGSLCVYASSPVDVVVDVDGWFARGTGFVPAGPSRVLDTRSGQPGHALLAVATNPVGPSAPLVVHLTGLVDATGSVVTPSDGLAAVALNVAVTGSAAAGYLTVFPCGQEPTVANLNFVAGQTVSNAVLAPVSPDGTICIRAMTPVDVVVDITGWFGG